jgi:ketosteroid isomerase-like protein
MTTDEAEIRALSDRYCDALTRADFAAIRTCYADDAIWEAPTLGMRSDGLDAIMAFNEAIVGNMEVLIQMAVSHIVTITGDTARLRSTVLELGRMRDGLSGMTNYGIYDSDLRRDPLRGWLFVHRRFHTILRDANPPKGEVFALPGGF